MSRVAVRCSALVVVLLLACALVGCDRRTGRERLYADGFVCYSLCGISGNVSFVGGEVLATGFISPFVARGWLENLGPRVWSDWVEFRAILFCSDHRVIAERTFMVRPGRWDVGEKVQFSVTFTEVDASLVGNFRLLFARASRRSP